MITILYSQIYKQGKVTIIYHKCTCHTCYSGTYMYMDTITMEITSSLESQEHINQRYTIIIYAV